MKKKDLIERLKEFESEEEIYLISFAPQVSYYDFEIARNGKAILLNPVRRLS